MRGYLLDENLPDQLPLSAIARQEGWAIVSKDADVADRIMLASPPPWIVHLRVGNLRLTEFRAFVARVWPQVETLLPASKLINVHQDRIEAIAEE